MSEGNAQNVAEQNDGTEDRGLLYEKRLCMLFALRAYIRDIKIFQIRYQVPEQEIRKFDDIVFDGGQKKCQVFKLIHKENQLFNESFNTNYNLLMYIKWWSDLNNTFKEIEMAVVLTNIDFDLQSDNELRMKNDPKSWYDCKTEIQLHPMKLDEDAIFDTSKYQYLNKKAKYYKFDDEIIIKILTEQKNMLIKSLAMELEKEVKATGNLTYNKQQENSKKNNAALKKSLENITEDDIRKALSLIIYTVGQPNDTELKQIIKKEIMEYFPLPNIDTVYNAFENAFTKWGSTKSPLNDPKSSSKQHIIDFKDVVIFFDKVFRKILFGVTAPTKSFTGRLDDLETIRKKLKEKNDLINSQNVAITGLGGIGKTELTKKFIDKYGQKDFYGRVIWIEAESDESVKKSFKRLAEIIEIPDRENKSLFKIIDQVFEYFYGGKVLFVFDNFDNTTEQNEVNPGNDVEKNFVTYCRELARALPKEDRPYFIFTSRNRECLPGVEPLNLEVLTKDEAKQLIMLSVKNSTNEDADSLAEKLQKFPLALKQAIAYINEQNEMKSVLGGRYEIKDYLMDFDVKQVEMLNFEYTNDFGEYEKTGFLTWNVTLNAILKEGASGQDAIQVLKIMSYLYADKIDVNMFLPLFENDETRCGKALILLNKYSLITKIENDSFHQIQRLVQEFVQLKFKDLEEEILVQALKSVNLELYKNFFAVEDFDDKKLDWRLFMEKCTVEEYLHYNNLSAYLKKYKHLNKNFCIIFDNIYDLVLDSAVSEDDIEKIKKSKVSEDVKKEYAGRNIEKMISGKHNKAIQYFIEDGHLDFKDNMPQLCIKHHNFDLFKYFVEKILSTELICNIKEGKSDSLRELIASEESETKLKESLFFASFYNQERIVNLLIDKKIEPDYKIEKWNINYAPIYVAANSGSHLVKILLKPFDKLKFWNDILQMIFEFLELVADINDVEHGGRNYTYLYYATNFYVKVKIAYILLNGISNPKYFENIDYYALSRVLKIIENDPVKKIKYKNCLTKMLSNAPQCEFITSLVEARIDDQLFDTLEMIKNINNYQGETELISCVRDLTINFVDIDNQLHTVKTIVNAGVDVDTTDHNEHNALYYAVDLDSDGIFIYLLSKTNSIHEKILMKAIEKNKLFCVEKLLETHFLHDHIFSDNSTLLEVAYESKSFKIIEYLLKLPKDNVNDIMVLINYIKNCIKLRCRVDLKYVQYLIDHGVDLNTKDSEEHDALYYSVELETSDLFLYLLSKDSFVHEETLERALELDKIRTVREIIPKYFKKNHCINNLSILKYAKQFEAKKVQKYLLSLNDE